MNATSAHVVITAQSKPKSGKGAARELRRNGFIPAVIYNKGADSQSIAIKGADLAAALRKGHFFTHNHELSLDGKTVKVLARDIQRDPVTDMPLHVDFIPYNPKSIVHVNVAVRIEGESESPGIKIGGVLQMVESQLEIVCRADSIPEEIVVSVAGLGIGDSVHMSSLTLPEGAKWGVTDRDLTIASIVSTRTSNLADEAADAAATAAPAESDAKAEAKSE